jgi:hypothetical protein
VRDGAQGANQDRYRFYVDGVEYTAKTFIGALLNAQTSAFNSFSVNRLTAGSNETSAAYRQVRVWDRALTPQQVRSEYLQGAKLLLLDGSIPDTGEVPESMAPITAIGQAIVGTPWRTVTASSNVAVVWRGGRRVLSVPVLNAIVSTQSPDPKGTGSWHIGMETGAGFAYLMMTASVTGNGYGLHVTGTGVYLYRIDNGTVGATLVSYATAAIALGTRYRYWVSRTHLGEFQVWIRGGAFTTWTSLGSATDTTHSVANVYEPANMSASPTYFDDLLYFRGAMTPLEATQLGLIEA